MPAPFKVPLVNHSTYTLVLSMWSFMRDRNKEEGETEGIRGEGQRSRWKERPTSRNGKDRDVCSLFYTEREAQRQTNPFSRRSYSQKDQHMDGLILQILRMMSF